MGGVLGIVSEYNPFHNGHLMHLNYSKDLTKADFTIAIMTGNFVQRGDTSLIDKWTKTEMALKAGIDLVIELPLLYAISSAENFADGAIKILDSLGIVDYLSFGSELGELGPIDQVASVLAREPKEFSNLISRQLKSGLSYPKARELALELYFGTSPLYKDILENPNNILGVEYLKSIKKRRSPIKAFTVKRDYSDYNSEQVKKGVASATAIRTMIKNKKSISKVVPFETYELLERQAKLGQIVPDLKVFEKQIIYNLRKMTLEEIANLPDVSEGLENRIKIAVNSYNDLDTVIESIKTKRYTRTRIQRIMLYALLDISQKDMNISKRAIPYIRVLGFNKHGKRIISAIAKENPKIKIIVSVKKFMEASNDNNLRKMLSKDIFATNVYTMAYKKEPLANLDYTKKVIEI